MHLALLLVTTYYMFEKNDCERRLFAPTKAALMSNFLDNDIEFTILDNTPFYRDFYQVDEMAEWINQTVHHFYDSGADSEDN